MDAGTNAYSLIVLGYRDYIAARVLLNRNYIVQGLTLASTAVEKYIKVLLVANGLTKSQINVHLDKLDKLKAALSSCYYDITQKIDDRFLSILGKVYSIRYYDDIKQPVTIGFFVNQFVGELDYVINLFETIVITGLRNEHGNLISTPYHQAISDKDKDLFENNYILNGLSKKEHMEKEDTGFAIHVHPDTLAHGELTVTATKIKNEYDGRIWEINLKFQEGKVSE